MLYIPRHILHQHLHNGFLEEQPCKGEGEWGGGGSEGGSTTSSCLGLFVSVLMKTRRADQQKTKKEKKKQHNKKQNPIWPNLPAAASLSLSRARTLSLSCSLVSSARAPTSRAHTRTCSPVLPHASPRQWPRACRLRPLLWMFVRKAADCIKPSPLRLLPPLLTSATRTCDAYFCLFAAAHRCSSHLFPRLTMLLSTDTQPVQPHSVWLPTWRR